MSEHPASTQDALGSAGACPEVRWGDKTYRVGFPTQRAKARLEALVAAQAVAEVRALRDSLDPAAYAEMFEAVNDAVRTRQHRTGGRMWQRALAEPGGVLLFPLALFREHHPDMTPEELRALMIAEPEQVRAALLQVVPGFFRAVGEEIGATPAAVEALIAQWRATLSAA